MGAVVAVAETTLRIVLVLATCVWVGGLVTLTVVARVASRTLGAADRVAFFRGLGRSYGIVGSLALVIGLVAGAVLVSDRPWTGLLAATAAVAAILVVVTVTGIAQARRMTRLRQRAVSEPFTPQIRSEIRRGSVVAAVSPRSDRRVERRARRPRDSPGRLTCSRCSGSHRPGVAAVGGEDVLEFDDGGKVRGVLVAQEEGDCPADQSLLVLLGRAETVQDLRRHAEPRFDDVRLGLEADQVLVLALRLDLDRVGRTG
jgi:uncharacterized membrane protein